MKRQTIYVGDRLNATLSSLKHEDNRYYCVMKGALHIAGEI